MVGFLDELFHVKAAFQQTARQFGRYLLAAESGCLHCKDLEPGLAEKGLVPPIYYALNLDGQEEYVQYLDRLRQKHGTRYGGIYSPNRRV